MPCKAVWHVCVWFGSAFVVAGTVIYVSGICALLLSTQVKLEFLIGNRFATPLFANFSNPSQYGLYSTEFFNLSGPAGNLGAWFVHASEKEKSKAFVLYLHGQAGSRAIGHRVELLDRLSKMGYHVLAFDYRGFADSDGWPTEHGMVDDSYVAYSWLLDQAKGLPVYIWGHSLGASIALQLASDLIVKRQRLNGVILDSPFNNFTDVLKYHPLFLPVVLMLPDIEPYFKDFQQYFRNDLWIQNVTAPILLLHSKDDEVIDVECARKLVKSSLSAALDNIKYVELDESLSHNYVMRARFLPSILGDFVFSTS